MKFSAFVCYERSKRSTGFPDFHNYVNYCKHYFLFWFNFDTSHK